jgi:hypothetical protein
VRKFGIAVWHSSARDDLEPLQGRCSASAVARPTISRPRLLERYTWTIQLKTTDPERENRAFEASPCEWRKASRSAPHYTDSWTAHWRLAT